MWDKKRRCPQGKRRFTAGNNEAPHRSSSFRLQENLYTQDEILALDTIHDTLDTKYGTTTKQLHDAFRALDKDNSCSVDKSELETFIWKHYGNNPQLLARAKDLLKIIDKNKDGKIDFNEWRALIHGTGPWQSRRHGRFMPGSALEKVDRKNYRRGAIKNVDSHLKQYMYLFHKLRVLVEPRTELMRKVNEKGVEENRMIISENVFNQLCFSAKLYPGTPIADALYNLVKPTNVHGKIDVTEYIDECYADLNEKQSCLRTTSIDPVAARFAVDQLPISEKNKSDQMDILNAHREEVLIAYNKFIRGMWNENQFYENVESKGIQISRSLKAYVRSTPKNSIKFQEVMHHLARYDTDDPEGILESGDYSQKLAAKSKKGTGPINIRPLGHDIVTWRGLESPMGMPHVANFHCDTRGKLKNSPNLFLPSDHGIIFHRSNREDPSIHSVQREKVYATTRLLMNNKIDEIEFRKRLVPDTIDFLPDSVEILLRKFRANGDVSFSVMIRAFENVLQDVLVREDFAKHDVASYYKWHESKRGQKAIRSYRRGPFIESVPKDQSPWEGHELSDPNWPNVSMLSGDPFHRTKAALRERLENRDKTEQVGGNSKSLKRSTSDETEFVPTKPFPSREIIYGETTTLQETCDTDGDALLVSRIGYNQENENLVWSILHHHDMFKDKMFPPNRESLFRKPLEQPRSDHPLALTTCWRRLFKIFGGENTTLFNDKDDQSVIKCGQRHADRLIAGLLLTLTHRTSGNSGQSSYLRSLFPKINGTAQRANKEGIYVVRLWYWGKWRHVIVDDYVPCNANGDPIFSVLCDPEVKSIAQEQSEGLRSYADEIGRKSDSRQLGYQRRRRDQEHIQIHLKSNSKCNEPIWLPLAIKAIAKLYGCFENIVNLNYFHVHSILSMITGGQIIPRSEPSLLDLWNYMLQDANSTSTHIVAYTDVIINENSLEIPKDGIHVGAVYTVLGATEMEGTNRNGSETHRLILLENPKRDHGWTGQWGASDEIWQEQPSFAMEMGVFPQNNNTNTFWMPFEMFVTRFEHVSVCSGGIFNNNVVSVGAQESTESVWFTEKAIGKWENNAKRESNSTLASQFELEISSGPVDQNQDKIPVHIQLDVFDTFENASVFGYGLRIISTVHPKNCINLKPRREPLITESFILDPGHYVIQPYTECRGQEGMFEVSVSTQSHCNLRPINPTHDESNTQKTAIQTLYSQLMPYKGLAAEGGDVSHPEYRETPQFIISVPNNGHINIAVRQVHDFEHQVPLKFIIVKQREDTETREWRDIGMQCKDIVYTSKCHESILERVYDTTKNTGFYDFNEEVFLKRGNYRLVINAVRKNPRHHFIPFRVEASTNDVSNMVISNTREWEMNSIEDKWTPQLCGGSRSFSTWGKNPYFLLELVKDGHVVVMLDIPSHAIKQPSIGFIIFEGLPRENTQIIAESKFSRTSHTTWSGKLKKGICYSIMPMTHQPKCTSAFIIQTFATEQFSFKKHLEAQTKNMAPSSLVNYQTSKTNMRNMKYVSDVTKQNSPRAYIAGGEDNRFRITRRSAIPPDNFSIGWHKS